MANESNDKVQEFGVTFNGIFNLTNPADKTNYASSRNWAYESDTDPRIALYFSK